MKCSKILSILLCSSIISFYSCNDSAETSTQETSSTTEVSDTPATTNTVTQTSTPTTQTSTPTETAQTSTPPKEAAQNEAGVWHYTCSKGCAGGAGAASSCSNCGTLLTHNTAYHSKTNTTPTANQQLATPYITSDAANTVNTTIPKEPSQNTAGVWHYTCNNGCAGGAGATGPCSTCGSTLSHNKAYHQ